MKANNTISNEYSVLRSFHSHDWMPTRGDYPHMLVNRRNNSQVYIIPLSRSSTVEDFQQYQFRSLHSNYLVRIYDIVKTQCLFNERSPKNTPSIYSVLIQSAIVRLDHPYLQLSIQEAFYAILTIVKAYSLLHSFFQLFQISNRMVWINEEGRIKLSYNENILSNRVQYPIIKQVQQQNQTIKGYKQKKAVNCIDKSKIVGIILKIIQIVQIKTNLKKKQGLITSIKRHVQRCSSMSEASSIIQEFCTKNSIYIPKFINKKYIPYHPDHKNPYHLNENGQYVCPQQETLVQTKKYKTAETKFCQHQKPQIGHRLTFLNCNTRSPTPLPFQERYSMGSPTLRDLQEAKRQLKLQKLRQIKQNQNSITNQSSFKSKKLLTEVKTPKNLVKKIQTISDTKKDKNTVQNQQQKEYSSNKLVSKYMKNRVHGEGYDKAQIKVKDYANDFQNTNISNKKYFYKQLKTNIQYNEVRTIFQSKLDSQTPKNQTKRTQTKKSIQQGEFLDKTVHKKTYTQQTHDIWSFRSNNPGDENIHTFFQDIVHKYRTSNEEKNKVISKDTINTYLRQKKLNPVNVQILDQAPPLVRQSTDREDARTFMDELDFSDQFDGNGSRINILAQQSQQDDSENNQSPVKKDVFFRANSFVNQAIESKVDEMQHPTDLQRKLNQIKMEDLMKQRKLRQARQSQNVDKRLDQGLYFSQYPKRQINTLINLPNKQSASKLANTDNKYQRYNKQKDAYNIDEKYNKYVLNKQGAVSYEGNNKIINKYYKPTNFRDLIFGSQKYKKNNNF